MIFSDIPSELLLEILSYLPLSDIHSVNLLSASWRSFVERNDSAIYRSAAFLHSYTNVREISLEVAKGAHWNGWMDDTSDWKTFCQKHIDLSRSWTGRGHAVVRKFDEAGAAVHRVKVDEVDRTIITTSGRGGLRVSCIKTGEALFTLPRNRVDRFSHLEYSNGFILFNGPTHETLEVWCRSAQIDSFTPQPTPEQGMPLQSQIGGRGTYRPYGIIQCPKPTRAYRFTFPDIVIAARAPSNDMWVWNVPSLSLVKTIQRLPTHPGEVPVLVDTDSVNYVDLNDKYIFVCTSQQGRVYSREDGNVLLRLPIVPMGLQECYQVAPSTEPSATNDIISTHWIHHPPVKGTLSDLILDFTAMHISPDGRDIVAVTGKGYLIYVRDWDERGIASINMEKTWVVKFDSPIHNMAFDGKRIAISTDNAIITITLTFPSSPTYTPPPIPPPSNRPPSPNPIPFNLPLRRPNTPFTSVFSSYQVISPKRSPFVPFISALQLTDTALWINWIEGVSDLNAVDISQIKAGCVDFSATAEDVEVAKRAAEHERLNNRDFLEPFGWVENGWVEEDEENGFIVTDEEFEDEDEDDVLD